jgi:hypothetical protein
LESEDVIGLKNVIKAYNGKFRLKCLGSNRAQATTISATIVIKIRNMATLNKNVFLVILDAVSNALFGFTKSGIILNSANGTVKVISNNPIPAIIAAFESEISLFIVSYLLKNFLKYNTC